MSQNQEISKKEQYNLNKLQNVCVVMWAKPLLTSI